MDQNDSVIRAYINFGSPDNGFQKQFSTRKSLVINSGDMKEMVICDLFNLY